MSETNSTGSTSPNNADGLNAVNNLTNILSPNNSIDMNIDNRSGAHELTLNTDMPSTSDMQRLSRSMLQKYKRELEENARRSIAIQSILEGDALSDSDRQHQRSLDTELDSEAAIIREKIARLEQRLQDLSVRTSSSSSTPATPVVVHTAAKVTKVILEDSIPRYGKSELGKGQKFRTLSNAMEFLELFQSQVRSIHGDNFPNICFRLLKQAILDDEERRRMERAIDNLSDSERTWEACELLFTDTLKTLAEKESEVKVVIRQGMRSGESYTRYAWRLKRMARIYKIYESAYHSHIVTQLKLSLPPHIIDTMNTRFILFHLASGQVDIDDKTRICNINDFYKYLEGITGPEDCEERLRGRDVTWHPSEDDSDRPSKRQKLNDVRDGTSASSKAKTSFFCHNGCGKNPTHDTSNCMICGNCKARGHYANKCAQKPKPSAPTAPDNGRPQQSSNNNSRSFLGYPSKFKGRNNWRGHQGSGTNASATTKGEPPSSPIVERHSSSNVDRITNAALSMHVTSQPDSSASDGSEHVADSFIVRNKNNIPLISSRDAVDLVLNDTDGSGSSPATVIASRAAVSVHPLRFAAAEIEESIIGNDEHSSLDNKSLTDILNNAAAQVVNNITLADVLYNAARRKDVQGEQRIIVNVSIFDNKHLALLDIGVSHSFISSATVEKYYITTIPSSGFIALADKSSIPRIGETENVKVKCGNHIVSAPFEVLEQEYDLTIGMDLFYRFGFNIQGLPDPDMMIERLPLPIPEQRVTLKPLDTLEEEKTEAFKAERKAFMDTIRPVLVINDKIPMESHCPVPEMKVYLPLPK
ncbi:hypothetical protein BGX27_002266, partial [Mortierella sp. AM989]